MALNSGNIKMQQNQIKTTAHKIIDQLPNNAGWEDIIKKMSDRQSIENGLNDLKHSRVVEHDEVCKRFNVKP